MKFHVIRMNINKYLTDEIKWRKSPKALNKKKAFDNDRRVNITPRESVARLPLFAETIEVLNKGKVIRNAFTERCCCVNQIPPRRFWTNRMPS